MGDVKNLYNIVAGRPFADDLAAGIRSRVSSPEEMADSIILLPNRRFTQSLRAAFLRESGGAAELLPRMMPMGDIEEDASELAIAGWDSGNRPPVISNLERQLLLATQLVDPSRGMAETFALADALARFLDAAQTAGCDMTQLHDLVSDDHADHWQRLLQLLNLITQWWPLKLESISKSDGVIWRDAALRARAQAWEKQPPKGLVVIAGSTGSLAPVRVLMQTVLGLERGYVVLPALDGGMDEDDWQSLIDDSNDTAICHPQFHLARLLDTLDCERDKVGPWLDAERGPAENTRIGLLREVFRPAERTEEWQRIPEKSVVTSQSLEGLRRIDCYDQQEEAEVIALAMREVLETPERTALLVTADKVLAKMVSRELSRWRIKVSSSAGSDLTDTAAARFLQLIAEAWIDDFAPVSLLALLQHSLAAGGLDKGEFRRYVRQMERRLLRGVKPNGLDGLQQRAKERAKEYPELKEYPKLSDFIQKRIIAPLAPLLALDMRTPHSLEVLVEALGEAGENMAATPANPLAIWHGREGRAVASFLQQLVGSQTDPINLMPDELMPSLGFLLAQEKTYPNSVDHPRLAIIGNVEARMQTADLIILGGMNEGVLPPHPTSDLWMSNAMRVDLGLLPAHWRVGPAAHDAYMIMAMPEVLITRAVRQDGAPTEMSRWLRRLEAVLDVAKVKMPTEQRLPRIAKKMHLAAGSIKPVQQPSPILDKGTRPRRFSATELDTLRQDPYAIYAKKVLRLRALDPLDHVPGLAERGSVIHDALQRFIRRYPTGAIPSDAHKKLIKDGEKAFANLSGNPWIDVFWRQQFLAIADWFIRHEQTCEDPIKRYAEIKGEMEIKGLTAPYTLTAKADRIDVSASKGVRIIDYKTGQVPSKPAVAEGRALQLLVEALLAANGGFAELECDHEKPKIEALEYWKLSGRGRDVGEINDRTPEGDVDTHAEKIITELLHRFDSDEAGYISEPNPKDVNSYSDYRHLARVGEWSLFAEESEDDHA